MAVRAVCLLLLTRILVSASEVDNIFSNGWRPISRESVFRDYWNMETPRLVYSVDGESLIREVDAPANLMMAGEWMDNNQAVNIVLPANRRHFESDFLRTERNLNVQQRKAKKIDIPNTRDKEDKRDDKVNTYEVVENIEEQNTLIQEQYDDKKENNLTDNLLKILRNYNIRTDDALPNYAISLKQESPNSNGGYLYPRVPINPRYNSANHAPADPLVALFLSHYGYYLPGLFGHQTNYRNLYSYVASNNIHNNKPFGAYKIFADSDSSL